MLCTGPWTIVGAPKYHKTSVLEVWIVELLRVTIASKGHSCQGAWCLGGHRVQEAQR